MEKEVYSGQIIKVTEEEIGGIVWERAFLPDGVIVYPIDDQGRILMIKEVRPHENPPYRIKAVSGILEHHKGTPAENAQREMQEEIGYKANDLFEFMTLKGNGTINHDQHFFIARNLIPSKLPNPDGEETILQIIPFEVEELMEMFLKDRIKWSMSALGFFRLYYHLKGLC